MIEQLGNLAVGEITAGFDGLSPIAQNWAVAITIMVMFYLLVRYFTKMDIKKIVLTVVIGVVVLLVIYNPETFLGFVKDIVDNFLNNGGESIGGSSGA
ncbi:TPA: TcpD family membrane protein [Enterococcus hirae]